MPKPAGVRPWVRLLMAQLYSTRFDYLQEHPCCKVRRFFQRNSFLYGGPDMRRLLIALLLLVPLSLTIDPSAQGDAEAGGMLWQNRS